MSWWPDVSESTIMKTADEIISFIQQSIALQKAVQALEAAAESVLHGTSQKLFLT